VGGVDVEQLIGEDHAARAIWELVGRLDLEGFYAGIECSEEEGGRPAFDPRLLISLWIYAYSQGIGPFLIVLAAAGAWSLILHSSIAPLGLRGRRAAHLSSCVIFPHFSLLFVLLQRNLGRSKKHL